MYDLLSFLIPLHKVSATWVSKLYLSQLTILLGILQIITWSADPLWIWGSHICGYYKVTKRIIEEQRCLSHTENFC